MFRRPAPDIVDLSQNSDATFLLLDDQRRWKHRLTERFVLGVTDHARVTSSYQLELESALLHPLLGRQHPRQAQLIIPLTMREKRVLLGLEVSGSHGPVHVLPRATIAAVEQEHLLRLALAHGGPRLLAAAPIALLEAACLFQPSAYATLLENRGGHEEAAHLAYLQGDQEQRGALPLRWTEQDVLRSAPPTSASGCGVGGRLGGTAFVHKLDGAHDPRTAATEGDDRIESIRQAFEVVQQYVTFVGLAAELQARPLLTVLAEYGRRYELLIETSVPLDDPCTIVVDEDRPMDSGDPGEHPTDSTALRQQLRLLDARSVHVEIRSEDPDIRITTPGLANLDMSPFDSGLIESARYTDEIAALYTSRPDRPYAAWLRMTPRLSRTRSVALDFVCALTVVSIFASVVMEEPDLI